MGFTVVSLGSLIFPYWYAMMKLIFASSLEEIAAAMITFGMGASSMALFAAWAAASSPAADVGRGLGAGKVGGHPQDDPRNPARHRRQCGRQCGVMLQA